MPVHDWTRVEAGIFHDFHVAWIAEIRKSLNNGLLPEGYYALAEQHAGQSIADLLTLHESDSAGPSAPASDASGTAVAEAPPKVARRQVIELNSLYHRRRTLAIRHVTGHRLVAIVEILSPANKQRAGNVDVFIEKVVSALEVGVHVLLVDLFPPGRFDPQGIHAALERYLSLPEESAAPAKDPVTLAAYASGATVEAYLEQVSIGACLTTMPLFLRPDRYVNVPLEATYMAAYFGMPAYWRGVLETGAPA